MQLIDAMGTLAMDKSLAQLQEILAGQQSLIVELRAENALLRAENDRLRAENADLRELVAELQVRVAELEEKVGPPSGKTVPGFVRPNREKAEKEGPRKKREQGFARQREEPTRRIVHAVEFCTGCGCKLLGGSVKHTRQVLHVPVVPAEVTEHVYL